MTPSPLIQCKIQVLVLKDEVVTLTIRRNTTAMEVFNLTCQVFNDFKYLLNNHPLFAQKCEIKFVMFPGQWS